MEQAQPLRVVTQTRQLSSKHWAVAGGAKKTIGTENQAHL